MYAPPLGAHECVFEGNHGLRWRAARAIKMASHRVLTITNFSRLSISKKYTIPVYGASSPQQHSPVWDGARAGGETNDRDAHFIAPLRSITTFGHGVHSFQ